MKIFLTNGLSCRAQIELDPPNIQTPEGLARRDTEGRIVISKLLIKLMFIKRTPLRKFCFILNQA
jgi:hypothetical protein